MCRLGLNGFDKVYSFGSYEGNLRELIHLFKFSGITTLAKPFGNFLRQALPREAGFDVIVPMPLHWTKRYSRGYNQSQLLSKEISKVWKIPVRNVVRRVRRTEAQAGLSSAQRRLNVRAAFRARAKHNVTGLSILLVDDVLTTGATASACARELKRAGAAHVALLTLARRDRRNPTAQLGREQ